MKEIWKDIKDYEGLYQVSNLSRVRSLERWEMLKNGYSRYRKGRILKTHIDKYGYERVMLYKDGKQKLKQVHRLVAEAFLPNPDNLPQVNHKDENPLNNVVSNLEWCNSKYNINFGTRNERVAEKLSKPVLQYTLDGEFVREWDSAIQAEREGGFNNRHIISVCKGKRPHHKGYIWKYKNPSDD